MARRRMISGSFFESQAMGRMKDAEKLLYLGLITLADDFGKGRANAALLRNQVWPYSTRPTSAQVSGFLSNLQERGQVLLYEDDGREFFMLPKFLYWNRLHHPRDSEIPNPPSGLVWVRVGGGANDDSPSGAWVDVAGLDMNLRPLPEVGGRGEGPQRVGPSPGEEKRVEGFRKPSGNAPETRRKVSAPDETRLDGDERRRCLDEEKGSTRGRESEGTRLNISDFVPSEKTARPGTLMERYALVKGRALGSSAWDKTVAATWEQTFKVVSLSESSVSAVERLLDSVLVRGVRKPPAKFMAGLKKLMLERGRR